MEKMLLNNSKIDYIISSGNYHRKVYKNGSSFLLKTLTSSGGNEGYSVTISAKESYTKEYTDCNYRDSYTYPYYMVTQLIPYSSTIESRTYTSNTAVYKGVYSIKSTDSGSESHTLSYSPSYNSSTSYSFSHPISGSNTITIVEEFSSLKSTVSTGYNGTIFTTINTNGLNNVDAAVQYTKTTEFNSYSIPTEEQTERLYTYSNSETYVFNTAQNYSTTYTRYYTSISSSTRSSTENFDFNGSNTTSISSNNSELLNMFSDTTMVSTKYEGSSSELCTLLITKTISSENNTYYLTY